MKVQLEDLEKVQQMKMDLRTEWAMELELELVLEQEQERDLESWNRS